jgi:peroxiredoxin
VSGIQPATEVGASLAAPADLRTRIRTGRYGTLVVLAVTALLVVAAATLFQRPSSDSQIAVGGRTDLTVGTAAADFQARTVTGSRVRLSDLRGHPVWVTFGASWCAACQAEAPDIQAAYERHAADGVQVVGVFISEDAQTVADYAKRVGLTYPAIADPNEVLADTYHVFGIPVHVFIDSEGTIRQVETGALSPQRIDQALAGLS